MRFFDFYHICRLICFGSYGGRGSRHCLWVALRVSPQVGERKAAGLFFWLTSIVDPSFEPADGEVILPVSFDSSHPLYNL